MAIIFGVPPFVVGTDDADQIFVNAGDGYAWLEGFGGNDFYEVQNLDIEFLTKIVEQAGGGIDSVLIDGYGEEFVSLDGLSQNDNTVEHLTIQNSESVSILGNALANRLTVSMQEGVTNDTLDGGAGTDTMEGGDGDDEYWVDVSGDVIIEQGGGGNDRVLSFATYVLPNEVEELYLQSNEGAVLNINGTGNALANWLDGNDGNNVLSGLGGDDFAGGEGGNDTLLGGDGNDYLAGHGGNDSLNGGNGSDGLYGREDNDRLDGGAGDDWLEGNEGNDSLLGSVGNDTMFGHDGVDTVDGGAGDDVLDGGEGDGSTDVLRGGPGNDEYWVGAEIETIVEAAGAGDDKVYSNTNFVLPVNVESLDLLGDATIGTGNAGNNFLSGSFNSDVLTGLAGNDVLDGAEGGDDTLIGGAGNDRYIVRSDDVVVEAFNQGTDTVFADLTNYVLGANVENLVLGNNEGSSVFALGNELNNSITAASFSADDVLRGLDGNDTLDGGEGGADSLYGGKGDDTYFLRTFDNNARAIELADEGIDTVFTVDNYVLGNNLEHLTILETGEGADAIGNELANRITGNANDNFLWGRGGNDTMAGGRGDDEYMVEQSGDVVTEAANAGQDHVMSWLTSHTLAANVEDLTLAPMAGQATATGNALNNVMVGNALANTLNGLGGNDNLQGGAGNDTLLGGVGNDTLDGGRGGDSMVGGAGNDEYLVNSLDDVVGGENSTLTGGGVDTVHSSVSVTGLWAGVENLFLTGNAGSATGNTLANQIFGNALRNTISGDAGNDLLDGGGGADTLSGGAGNDTLDGGFGNDVDTMFGDIGNDTYILDRADDLALDVPGGGGTDTVVLNFNSSPYSLEGTTIENIVFGAGFNVGNATGNESNNRLTGNEFDNHFLGGDGNDTLIGNDGNDTLGGGSGNDSMVGGAGNDFYSVDRFTGDTVVEAINSGSDRIELNIFVAGTYVLPANVEEIVLIGSEGAAVNVTGNALDNLIDAGEGSGNNTFRGGAGNDTLFGYAGNDTLLGEAGDDSLAGGVGADSMAGGLGNDTYEVADIGDFADELANQGIDTVNLFGAEGGITSFTLDADIENLNVNQNNSGISVTANGLANTITFDVQQSITLAALGGDDTVTGANGIASAAALISLDGGAGANDALLLQIGEGGNYTNLDAPGFELIVLNVSGAATWDATPGAFNISGSGAALALTGQSLATAYRFANFSGSLNLGFADASGDNDLATVRLVDNVELSVVAAGLEILNVQTEAGGALDVTGLDAGAQVDIAGPGTVDLLLDADTSDIGLVDYSGERLSLFAGESGQSHTIHLDNANTTIDVGSEGFSTITLDTTGSDSDVSVVGESLNTLDLVSDDGNILLLHTQLLAGVTVDGGDFLGNLVLRNSGANITYNAGDSVDWLLLHFNANETLNYGNNLGSEDIIEDEGFGDDSDELNATFDSSFQGALAITGIETINLTFGEGGNFLDAAFIEGFETTLNVTTSSDVTIESLRANLSVTGAGAVSAFLIGTGEGVGGYSVQGGSGADELWVDGDVPSDDTLNGGAGSDTLLGGAGEDDFVFDTALGAGNVDTILDFESDVDTMVLDRSIFTAVVGEGPTLLDPSEFLASADGVANAAGQRILYNTTNGALYYDADGSGAGARIQFAQLGSEAYGTGVPDILYTDFNLVA